MLGLRLDDRHWCGVLVDEDRARAIVQIGDVRQELGSMTVPQGRPIVLRVSTVPPKTAPVPFGYAGPDDVVLSVDVDGKSEEIARLDGRYFSTEVAAGFTGRMLGLGSPNPEGRVLSISYRPQGHGNGQGDRPSAH